MTRNVDFTLPSEKPHTNETDGEIAQQNGMDEILNSTVEKIQDILEGGVDYQTVGFSFKRNQLLNYSKIKDIEEVLSLIKGLQNTDSPELAEIRKYILNGLIGSISHAEAANLKTGEHLIKFRDFYVSLIQYADSTETGLAAELLETIEEKLAGYAATFTDSSVIANDIFHPQVESAGLRNLLMAYRAFEKVQNNFFDKGFSQDLHIIEQVEKLESIQKNNPFLKAACHRAGDSFDVENFRTHLAADTIGFIEIVQKVAPEYLHLVIDAIVDKAKSGIEDAFQVPTNISEFRALRANRDRVQDYINDMRDLSHFTETYFNRGFFSSDEQYDLETKLDAVTNMTEEQYFDRIAGGMGDEVVFAPGFSYEGDPIPGVAIVKIDLTEARAAYVMKDNFPIQRTIEERVIEATSDTDPMAKHAVVTFSAAHFITDSDFEERLGMSARPYVIDGKVVNSFPDGETSGRLDEYLNQNTLVIRKDGTFSIETMKSALQTNRFGQLIRDKNGNPIAKADVNDIVAGTYIPDPNSEQSFHSVQQSTANFLVQYNDKIFILQSSNSKHYTVNDIKQILGLPFDADFGTGPGKMKVVIYDPGRSLGTFVGTQTGDQTGDVKVQDILSLTGLRAIRNGIVNPRGTPGNTPAYNSGTVTFTVPLPQ